MKTIIIYSTKYGSVEKAANMLKKKIGGDVALVNVKKEIPPALTPYDNIILGGSIYVGKIQKELSDYILANLQTLLAKNVGLYICAAQEGETLEKELTDSFPPELLQHARIKEAVGYELCLEKLGFFDRMATRFIKGTKASEYRLNETVIGKIASAFSVLKHN
ncbi:MAG: flavodoxin domain-containing protein [Bacillota bacterium]